MINEKNEKEDGLNSDKTESNFADDISFADLYTKLRQHKMTFIKSIGIALSVAFLIVLLVPSKYLYVTYIQIGNVADRPIEPLSELILKLNQMVIPKLLRESHVFVHFNTQEVNHNFLFARLPVLPKYLAFDEQPKSPDNVIELVSRVKKNKQSIVQSMQQEVVDWIEKRHAQIASIMNQHMNNSLDLTNNGIMQVNAGMERLDHLPTDIAHHTALKKILSSQIMTRENGREQLRDVDVFTQLADNYTKALTFSNMDSTMVDGVQARAEFNKARTELQQKLSDLQLAKALSKKTEVIGVVGQYEERATLSITVIMALGLLVGVLFGFMRVLFKAWVREPALIESYNP